MSLSRLLPRPLRRKYQSWKEKNESKLKEYGLMWYAFKRSPISVAGLIIVVFMMVFALFSPQVLSGTEQLMNFLSVHKMIKETPEFNAFDYSMDLLQPPSWRHWFGTDEFGRDMFARCMLGLQISLAYAVTVITLGVPLGIILGLVAGYYGGKVDELISRVTDIFFAFPSLILAMALAASLGAGMESAIIAMIVVWWPGYVRLIRGQVLSVRENLYVEAARAAGMSDFKIIIKHIAPNVLTPVIIYLTMDMAGVVLMGAGLSFIGLGAQPPTPELGRLVYDGLNFLPQKWWYSLIPGFILFIWALGFNLLGDGLRDVLDPRYRRRLEFKMKEKKKKVERRGEEQNV